MKFLTLIVLIGSLQASAQKNDTLVRYFDESLIPVSKKSSALEGVVYPNGDRWKAEVRYSNNQPAALVTFLDKKLKVRDGKYLIYNSKGNLMISGNYDRNVPEGVWIIYHDNGQMKDSGLISHNNKIGQWVSYYPDGKVQSVANYTRTVFQDLPEDSDIPLRLLDSQNQYMDGLSLTYHPNGQLADSTVYLRGRKYGYSKGWYPNGNVEWEGVYLNDRYEGFWKWFHPNGKPCTVENYVDRKLVDLECFDSTGKSNGPFCSIEKPAYLDGLVSDYRQFVHNNLNWPDQAFRQKINGRVFVQFEVSPIGKLQNFKIVSATHKMFADEVERVFKEMPDWVPAISHNRAVKAEFTMNIPFLH